MTMHAGNTDAPRTKVRTRVFWRPRHGHSEEEYEDAYAVSGEETFPVHAAVADGATESAFARRWAQILTEGFIEQGIHEASALRAVLPTWQAHWSRSVAERTRQQPWYAAAKAEQGAFATVLGLTLRSDGTWRALSVGDCCLFHFREGALRTIWPIDDPDAFTHRPALVPSRASHALPPPEQTSGTWERGDVFLLASDALAAWMLRTDPAAPLALDDDTFPARIRAARDEGHLRNDDVTLLTVHILAT